MGLFEKAGRRFEKFKREARTAAEEEAEYECAACGTRSYARRNRCPECGADGIVPVEAEDDAPETRADEGTETRADDERR